MTKNGKKIQLKKKLNFFGSKTTIYLSLGLHKERPRYRRSLQLSKEAIQHFKTWTLKKFSTFVGLFCPPGSGSTDPIESGSNPDPDPQPWFGSLPGFREGEKFGPWSETNISSDHISESLVPATILWVKNISILYPFSAANPDPGWKKLETSRFGIREGKCQIRDLE